MANNLPSERTDASGIDQFGCMRAFMSVVELGTFSAAARRMGIATSTLTRQISTLERSLGTTLIVRSTHHTVLTDAGKIYFSRSKALLSELDDTLRVVSELDSTPSGSLKLIAPVAFGRLHLAPLIVPFLDAYPHIQLDIRLTDNHGDMLTEGFDLDIHEGENHLDNLIAQSISCNQTVLCATPGYLARHGIPRHPDDLQRHNCLRYLHPDGDPYWHFLLDDVRHSVFPKGNLQADHNELLLQATCAGGGICDFEVWLIREHVRRGELVVVLPDYRLVNRLTGERIYMAYLPSRRFSAKVKVLRDFIAERLNGIGELPLRPE
jgi:DNA-binding transcriptional LysR family regulator